MGDQLVLPQELLSQALEVHTWALEGPHYAPVAQDSVQGGQWGLMASQEDL